MSHSGDGTSMNSPSKQGRKKQAGVSSMDLVSKVYGAPKAPKRASSALISTSSKLNEISPAETVESKTHDKLAGTDAAKGERKVLTLPAGGKSTARFNRKTYSGHSAKSSSSRVSLIERATRTKTQDVIEYLDSRDAEQKGSSKNTSEKAKIGMKIGVTPLPSSPEKPPKKKDALGFKVLNRVTEEGNEMTRKVERQKRMLEQQDRKLSEVQRKIQYARNELRKRRKNQIGCSKGVGPSGYYVKLDSLHLRLNKAISKNQEIREKINDLRQQQVDDMAFQKDMLEENSQIEEEILTVNAKAQELRAREVKIREEIKQVNATSEAKILKFKEDWRALSVFVDQRSEKEQKRIWEERKEKENNNKAVEDPKESEEQKVASAAKKMFGGGLGAGLRKQMVLRKQSTRAVLQGNKAMQLMGIDALEDKALAGKLTVNEENQLKSNIQQSRWQIARGQVALHNLQGKADNLEEGFNMIREKTGIDSPSTMVETFLSREEEIFRLFTHVNLLSEQLEELEQKLEEEKGEVDRMRGSDDESLNGRSILKSLEDRLGSLSTKTAKHEQLSANAIKIIEAVKSAVNNMFTKIGCDTKLIANFAFSKATAEESETPETTEAGAVVEKKAVAEPRPLKRASTFVATPRIDITEKNLLQYIGVIEQRVSELLMVYQITTKQKPDDGMKGNNRIQMLPTLPSTADGTEDWSDDDLDGECVRPLSYQELLYQVSNKTTRRRGSHSHDNSHLLHETSSSTSSTRDKEGGVSSIMGHLNQFTLS